MTSLPFITHFELGIFDDITLEAVVLISLVKWFPKYYNIHTPQFIMQNAELILVTTFLGAITLNKLGTQTRTRKG